MTPPAPTANAASETKGSAKPFASTDGEFRRQVSSFRDTISSDPGAKFTPEAGRYHIYYAAACPWAHRTIIVRALKGLEDVISVTPVSPTLGDLGWAFGEPEPNIGAKHLRELYFKAEPEYNARFTVPVLWDKKTNTIVNNESSEIIRILNTAFQDLAKNPGFDITPPALLADIDAINDWVYNDINNGVYKTGFATNQEVYEKHCRTLFAAMDRMEHHLSTREWLVGEQFTEADIRLFTTLIRWNPTYHCHFKCNIKDFPYAYPNLEAWVRRVYQLPKIADTVDFDSIVTHYFNSHLQVNPTGVVPLSRGPNWNEPKATYKNKPQI